MDTKSNVLPLYANTEVVEESVQVDTQAEQLFENMINGYQDYRLGTRRHTDNAISESISAVRRLQSYTGLYPWEWTLDSWDKWNASLVKPPNSISPATQRKYQTHIRLFIDYVISREMFIRDIKKYFGCSIKQFFTKECLRHVYVTEQKQPRPHFTPKQYAQFFGYLKSETERYRYASANSKNREVLNFKRDLTFFYLMKATGLRSSSLLAMTLHSFTPNSAIPEMGEYGAYTTTGKGSPGSGHKVLNFLIDDHKIPPLLDWYIKYVRPEYLKSTNPNETALFLSERGQCLSYPAIYNRFNAHIENAGLKGVGLVMHSFRHTAATEGIMEVGLEITRQKLGHEFGSTTQRYGHCDDEYANRKLNASLAKQFSERQV